MSDEYYDSDEFRNMLAEYEEAISSGQPVFMDADELSEIADYYQMTNCLEEAEKAISLALSLSPGAIAPLTYRIHEALFEGNTEKARELLDQIIEKDEPDYIYDQGEILLTEGRDDEANAYFEECMKTVPADELQDYVFDVASILNDYERNDLALEWMKKAKHEDTPDFKELMARALYGVGKYKDSERLFNELIDTNPFSKKYWNQLASAQFMNEDYSAAVQSSEYAIAIDPEDPEGLVAKANGLYQLANYEEAVEYYRRYAELMPDDEYAYLHQGACLVNLERYAEAIEALLTGIEVAPQNSSYLSDICQELAFAYSELNQTDKALQYLDLTDTMDCDHVHIKVIKGHVLLAAGRYKEAEDNFRRAVLESPNPQPTLLHIIVSLYDNHFVNASYRLFKKYFNMAGKDNIDGYAYMALCCYDLKKNNEFLTYLKKACEVNPRECRNTLAHLFPEDLQPQDYYKYICKEMRDQL